ncbi:MAG: radical SAM/SPASM domain-containing protein [Bacteroidota bacterium]
MSNKHKNISANAYHFFRMLKVLKTQRVINYLKIHTGYFLSKWLKKPVVWGDPFSLSLETAAVCNLRCPECAIGCHKTQRMKKYMDLSLFEALVKHYKKTAFYCNLYFQGEPFLNPDIYTMIKTCKKNQYYTVISTNGHFLHEKNCTKIIDAGLDKLIVSLDGTDQQTYQTYRKGGNFHQVTEGIQLLTKKKEQLGSNHPFVVIQFLVSKANEHQIQEIKKLSEKLGANKLEFKSMQIYSEQGMENFSTHLKKYNRYAGNLSETGIKTKRKSCFRLWSHAVFTSEGRQVACCFDKTPDHASGYFQPGKTDLWRSKTMDDLRYRLLNNKDLPKICQNCTT